MENNYPLILVFYIHRDLIASKVIYPFVESVNQVIADKNANAIAFFVPTDKEERIECINPIQIKEQDMTPIYQMVEDIAKNFDIGKENKKTKKKNDTRRKS